MSEDETFFCPECKPTIKKHCPDGLDIDNIIGDLESGPGTRRSRYVNSLPS
jgi:hypothetical protein